MKKLSKTGLFLRFELVYFIFFLIYGIYNYHWRETKLNFLDYTLIALLSSFAYSGMNRFNEILNYFKL